MALDEETIQELKSALLKEKTELEENLSSIAKPIDKTTGNYAPAFEDIGTDRDDNATEVEQYADNLQVEMTLEKKLQDIIEALEKMENGTYGICNNCKQEIDIQRLKINPSAKICVKCK